MPSALFQPLLLTASSTASIARSTIPAFLYGCAWKKEKTADLVYQALSTGFRGIDVAAQPRHYREDLAGDGIRRALAERKLKREELFIQTKFTSVDGQDQESVPYDAHVSVAEQVKQSVKSSLHNLRPTDEESSAKDSYIDSFVLHSPLRTLAATSEAWSACESFIPSGQIRNLGISNTNLKVLEHLYETCNVKPSVVQNRFYRDTDYDVPLRRFCRKHGIVYQSFWTLGANQKLLRHPSVVGLAKTVTVGPEVALYALVMALDDTVVLNGTQTHMAEDVEGLEKIRVWATDEEQGGRYEWENTVKHFKDATGDNNSGAMPEEMLDMANRKPLRKFRNL